MANERGLFMKDFFFSWLDKVHLGVYKFVTYFTYFILTKRRLKEKIKLTKKETEDIKKFWGKYHIKCKFPMHEYRWYKAHGVDVSPYIIPDTIWHVYIEPYFNSFLMEKGFDDKNYFERILGKENTPHVVLRCIDNELLDEDYKNISSEKAEKIIGGGYRPLICKPSINTGGGRGICFIDENEKPEIKQLIKQYNGNFVVQGLIKQHEFFSQFNSTSLNTLRIVTVIFEGRLHYLSGFLRVGANGERLDNVSKGGLFIPVFGDGRLSKSAWAENLETHDLERKEIKLLNEADKLQIPYWDKVLKLLEEKAFILSHFKLINWDVCINYNGDPIIIEYNLMDSSPYFHQLNIGPIFGKITDEVLSAVFINN